jgi:hypothetical protein
MNTHTKTIFYITALLAALFSALGYWSVSKKATLDNYIDHTAQMDALSYGIFAAKKAIPWEEMSILTLKNGEFIKPLVAKNFEHFKLDYSGDKWVVLTIQNSEMYHMDYCQWLMTHQNTALNSAVALQRCGDGNVQLLFSN